MSSPNASRPAHPEPPADTAAVAVPAARADASEWVAALPVGPLADGPAHALRTPLTAIAGALGLLGAGVGGELPESAHRLLQIALRNCQALESAVETHLAHAPDHAGPLIRPDRIG